jgi:hypothetical protein
MTEQKYIQNIGYIIFSIIIVLLVSYAYFFVSGIGNSLSLMNLDSTLFKNIELKTAYTPDGKIKIFANALNNQMNKLDLTAGNNIPERNSMILGSEEANMMLEEKLFKEIGDPMNNFFGINTTIGGILKKTGMFMDDFHFLSSEQFKQLNGDSKKVFVVVEGEDDFSLFYTLLPGEKLPIGVSLVEGNISNYNYAVLKNDIQYMPILLGFNEAEMMREEGEFNKIGDTLESVLGKKAIVIGVFNKTSTALDMMHFIPLEKSQVV